MFQSGSHRGFCGSRFFAFTVVLLVTGCSVQQPSAPTGTSIVVLVDFSKSFVPLSKEDQRSLEAVSAATADLAKREWQSPVSILWSRIQTASLLSDPLCGPLQYQQTLIKHDSGERPIEEKLHECTNSTISASTKSSEQSQYTDISGAIELAKEQGQSILGPKYLVIISDFVEDLPASKRPMTLQLNGEHVLLLHRLGTDRTQSALFDHLSRITRWIDVLRSAGAASVVAMPLASATRQRITRALGAGTKAGTDVVILQNLPDSARTDVLKTLAMTVNSAARDWDSPVTVTWADMRDAPAAPWQMPPLNFTARLIKDQMDGDSLTSKDFQLFLGEYAEAMRRFSPGAKKPDINASIRFYASAGVLDAVHIFLIVSSFPNAPKDEPASNTNLSGMRVVMLAAPNREDADDESAYVSRVSRWEERFKQQRASVCRLPLNGLTPNSLMRCMYGH